MFSFSLIIKFITKNFKLLVLVLFIASLYVFHTREIDRVRTETIDQLRIEQLEKTEKLRKQYQEKIEIVEQKFKFNLETQSKKNNDDRLFFNELNEQTKSLPDRSASEVLKETLRQIQNRP